jgi:carbohydrate-binding DOMON domain-containing protein
VKYELEVDNDRDFQSTLLSLELVGENLTTVKLRYISVEKFPLPVELALPEGTWYWRVRAYDNAGIASGWSENWRIEVYTIHIGEETPVFDAEDPEGDDFGPGTYTYPLSWEFVDRPEDERSGAFDLLRFKVTQDENFVIFRFRFKDVRGDPWGGPYGFSLQHVQVYLDTAPGGISESSPRLPADFNSALRRTDLRIVTPWEYALVIGPGWSGHRDDSHTNLVVDATDPERILTHRDMIQILPDLEKNEILAAVPKELVGEPTDRWDYAVIVFSHDGYSNGCVRTVALRRSTWEGGGADPQAYTTTIDGWLGIAPRAYDVLAPTIEDQKQMLTSYVISDDPTRVECAGVFAYKSLQRRPLPFELLACAGILIVIAVLIALKVRGHK